MNADNKESAINRDKLSEAKSGDKFAKPGSVAFRYWLSQKANKRRKRNES